MRFLRTNTACRITVGPFFDKTDGVTPETAITVTSCKLTLMVDDGNVPTLILDTAPTASGGANDMVHVTGDDAGFYDLELAAANVNYVGRAMLSITDAATHCPVFHEFMILPAKVYDSLFLGTDNLEVDAIQWLGTAAATPTVAGVPEVDVTHLLGTAWLTPGTAGTPDVNAKLVGGQTASAAGTVTFPGTIASTTNITAGTITTVTNLTNAPTAGDLTATMKASVNTEIDTALADVRLDELLAADSDIDGAAPPTVGSVFHELMTKTTGSFTFDQTTDSLEALRDRGDAAWITATGFSTLDAAGVRTAVGLASANLDTQLADLPTVAEFEARTLVAAGYASPTNITAGTITTVGSVTGAVGSVTGAVGSVTGNVGGNVTGTIGGLTAAALKDFFDTDSTTTYASAVAGSVVKEIADNAGGSALTEAGIADAVWDEILSGHAGVGSTGAALSAAGGSGDPWSTALPGAYSSGTAGHTIGTYLTGNAFTRLGAPAGASIAADLAIIDGIVDGILVDTAEIGAAGAGLTNINLPNQTMDIVGNITGNLSGSVGSVTGTVGGIAGTLQTLDAIWAKIQKWLRLGFRKDSAVATDHATELSEINANGGSGAGGYLSTTDSLEAAKDAQVTTAQVNAEVDTALTDIHLDHLLAADYDPASKPGVATALLNELIGSDAGVSQFTANALELGPSGGASAASIADAVWDELLSGHVIVGSAGAGLSAAGSAGDPWSTALPGAYALGTAGYAIGNQGPVIWSYATRTLTGATQSVGNSLAAGATVTAYRAGTWEITLTGLGVLTGWTKLVVTLRSDLDDTDDNSLVQIQLSSPSSASDGLLYINGDTAATKANGSITVNDAVTGSITISLAAVESAKLSHQKTKYDVKKYSASGATFMSTDGVWFIKASPTRATS